MDMCLPKFDIYQGTLAFNCFKSHTYSWFPGRFQKHVLSGARSEIHHVRRNVVPNAKSDRALKNCIQAW